MFDSKIKKYVKKVLDYVNENELKDHVLIYFLKNI